MNLKTSYFNTTLFKANLKRFWWVAAIFFVGFLTFGILPIITDNDIEGFYMMTIIACIISAVMPTILFSYLDFPGSVTCMHAFPIKRKAHYITHIFTIYALILVPTIICSAIAAPLCAYRTSPLNYGNAMPHMIWQNLLVMLIYITIFTSAGTLGNMVTGNPISAIAFTGLFAAFPYYTEIIFKSFLNENIFGMPSYNNMVTMQSTRIDCIMPFMKWLAVIWAVMLIASWFLYRFRNLEAHGDIIAFKFLKPIFIGCVSMFLGLLGYFYLMEMLGIHTVFFLLPFGLIGVIISNMLTKKAFTLKGAVKPGTIYIVAVVLVWAVFRFDLTGYERRIPKTSDIASVRITPDITDSRYGAYYNGNFEADYAGSNDGEPYYYSEPMNLSETEFTDSADIENVRTLHKYLIDNRNIRAYRSFPIMYTLKNGKTVKRLYSVNYDDQYDMLKPLFETKQMRLEKYYIFRDFTKTITSINVTDSRILGENKLFATYYENDEKSKAIFEALKEDVMSADAETVMNYNGSEPIQITINYMRPVENEKGKEYKRVGTEMSDQVTIGVTDDFKKTLALLNEYGLPEKRVTPEQIAYAIIRFNHSDNSVKVTDKASVDELYNMPYGTSKSDPIKPTIENVYQADIIFYDVNDIQLFYRTTERPSSWPLFMLYEAKKFADSIPKAEASDTPNVTVEETESF